jgi:hypothetical protein
MLADDRGDGDLDAAENFNEDAFVSVARPYPGAASDDLALALDHDEDVKGDNEGAAAGEQEWEINHASDRASEKLVTEEDVEEKTVETTADYAVAGEAAVDGSGSLSSSSDGAGLLTGGRITVPDVDMASFLDALALPGSVVTQPLETPEPVTETEPDASDAEDGEEGTKLLFDPLAYDDIGEIDDVKLENAAKAILGASAEPSPAHSLRDKYRSVLRQGKAERAPELAAAATGAADAASDGERRAEPVLLTHLQVSVEVSRNSSPLSGLSFTVLVALGAFVALLLHRRRQRNFIIKLK